MKKVLNRGAIIIMLLFSALLVMPGCAATKKNPYYKKKKASIIDTSQLGRNKYFFSTKYQKKLYKYKKK